MYFMVSLLINCLAIKHFLFQFFITKIYTNTNICTILIQILVQILIQILIQILVLIMMQILIHNVHRENTIMLVDIFLAIFLQIIYTFWNTISRLYILYIICVGY
mgnify:CR=1 FL=1